MNFYTKFKNTQVHFCSQFTSSPTFHLCKWNDDFLLFALALLHRSLCFICVVKQINSSWKGKTKGNCTTVSLQRLRLVDGVECASLRKNDATTTLQRTLVNPLTPRMVYCALDLLSSQMAMTFRYGTLAVGFWGMERGIVVRPRTSTHLKEH